QQEACAFLLQGQNPYAAEYPNPYDDTRFFGPEVIKDGKVQSFPYPPLSLLLSMPGYLLGDVRWSLLLAILGTAAFLVATGRRLGLPAGHPAELAVIALLCHPRGLLVLEAAWTEPFLALAISACAWTLAAGQRRPTRWALAAGLGAKQFGLLWFPAVWASGRIGWRDVVFAITGAILLAIPFLMGDPAAFWRGVIAFHVYSPFREDSLSVLALIWDATKGSYQPPSAL